MLAEHLNDDIYYHDLSEYQFMPETEEILQKTLGKDWNICRDRIYLFCLPRQSEMLHEGWKIHVSSSLHCEEQVLARTIEILAEEKCPFKVIGDSRLHELTLQKDYSRQESGKYITIYPFSLKQFERILSHLYRNLKGCTGQFILSDRRYKDSPCIYYRYGSFTDNFTLTPQGRHISWLRNTEGQMVRDARTIPFSLPEGIPDWNKTKKCHTRSRLMKKYKIFLCLHMSNAGGVYLAESLPHGTVVIKEARANLVEMKENPQINAAALLKNEFEVLQKVKKEKLAPEPYELLDDWENRYLVEEYLEGRTLYQFSAENNPLYHGSPDQKDFVEYYTRVNQILSQIARGIDYFAQNGCQANDLEPDNIMIMKKGQVKFLDLESYGMTDLCMGKTRLISGMPKENAMFLNLMCFLLFAHEKLLWYDPDILHRIVSYIENSMGLELGYHIIIQQLMDGKATLKDASAYFASLTVRTKEKETQEPFDVDQITTAIRNKAMVNIQSLPMNPKAEFKYEYAYGLAGIAECTLDNKVLCQEYMLNEEKIPAGLFNGKLGLVWYLLENQQMEKAGEILVSLKHSPLFTNNYSLGFGIAGYLLCCEKYLFTMQDEEIEDIALEICSLIIRKRKENQNFFAGEDKVPYGFAEGACGIALPLLYAYILFHNKACIDTGRQLLKDEMKHLEKLRNSKGLYLPWASDDERKVPISFMEPAA